MSETATTLFKKGPKYILQLGYREKLDTTGENEKTDKDG